MDSSNPSWRSPKAHSGHAITQETRTHSVGTVAAHNVHSATSQGASAPAARATARVTPQTAQRQPGAAATSARSPQASSRKQLFIVPQRRSRVTQQPDADKPVAFAVQLYPDMSSLTLAQPGHQQGSPTVFSGGEAPDHHGYTAVHDYIASVCPNEAAAFGADVWLDTFHTTLGDLELPMSKVPEFQHSINTIVADSLHPESLANLTYTTTQLGYTKKENRLKKDIKGVHFYHLGVKAPADQLAEFLQPWMAAMQRAAAAVGAKFVDKPFREHHITIRCHTKKPVDRQVLQKVSNAVQHSPFSLRVAGIRVQLAASQALDLCGPEHIKTHVGSDGSEVRYPVPIFTSGAAASVLLERGHQAPCPPRAIPCNAPESEDGAGIEEVTRLTAEPLVVPAQNGTGFVWQNEMDSTVPKCERPTLPILAGCVPPNGDIGSSDMASSLRPEAEPVSTAAAAFQVGDLAGADPGSLPDSDSVAEQLAELSMDASPAGLPPAKEGNKERGSLVPLTAHS